MKILKSKKMKKLMKNMLRRWNKKFPRDGMHAPILYKTEKNGWHYQGGITNDSRYEHPKFACIYAFKPPRVMWAKSAEYIYHVEL